MTYKTQTYLYGFKFTSNIIYLNIHYCIKNSLQSKQVLTCKIERDAEASCIQIYKTIAFMNSVINSYNGPRKTHQAGKISCGQR